MNRGNKYTLNPMKPMIERAPDEPTAYEAEAARLGLGTSDEAVQAADSALRQWVLDNWRSMYVPEGVLALMGLRASEYAAADGTLGLPHRRERGHRAPYQI